MNNQVRSNKLINLQVAIGAIIIGFTIFVVLTGFLWLTHPRYPIVEPALAELSVIKAPTLTPTQDPENPTSNSTTSNDELSQAPEELLVGVQVYVKGTQGDGLRLRYDPGLNNDVRLLGNEGEEFQIEDGPKEADGYTWWYIVATGDETRHGWAVADFISNQQ